MRIIIVNKSDYVNKKSTYGLNCCLDNLVQFLLHTHSTCQPYLECCRKGNMHASSRPQSAFAAGCVVSYPFNCCCSYNLDCFCTSRDSNSRSAWQRRFCQINAASYFYFHFFIFLIHTLCGKAASGPFP